MPSNGESQLSFLRFQPMIFCKKRHTFLPLKIKFMDVFIISMRLRLSIYGINIIVIHIVGVKKTNYCKS